MPSSVGATVCAGPAGAAWLGYLGGLAALVVALVGFVQTETPWLGLDRDSAEHVRIVGPLVAAWFVVFGWPLWVGLVVPTVITAVYTLAAGYWGVVMGDFLQGIVAIFAIVLVSLVGVFAVGGPTELTNGLVSLGETWRLDAFAFTGVFSGDFPIAWWLTMLVIAVVGGFLVGSIVLLESLVADTVDYDELRTGQKREGIYFGFWKMSTKIARAGAIALADRLKTETLSDPSIR